MADVIRVDKNDICNILGIKSETLKKIIKNKQLDSRLDSMGYVLIGQYKEGRNVYYELKIKNDSIEIYNKLCKFVYRTENMDGFKTYFIQRTVFDIVPQGKGDIAMKSNVSLSTIKKWDNILIDNKLISKDGYFYFNIYTDENGEQKLNQCSKEEYNSFWKNKSYLDAFDDLQKKYINGEITLNQLQLASAEIGAIINTIERKYYYRIKKYKTNTNNGLYIDTKDLIKKIYSSEMSEAENIKDIIQKRINLK